MYAIQGQSGLFLQPSTKGWPGFGFSTMNTARKYKTVDGAARVAAKIRGAKVVQVPESFKDLEIE